MGKFGLLHHSNSRTAAVARFPHTQDGLARRPGVRVPADATCIIAPRFASP